MDPQSVTLPLAFLAGLLSFASPCVLPLVPAYMGYLSGTAVTLEEQPGKRRQSITAFGHSTVFVLGFMAVFVVLGASATFLGSLLLDYRLLLQRVGGVLLVIFGMRLMGTGWSRRRWVGAAIVVATVTFVLHSGLLTMGRIELDEYALVWLQESLMMGLVVLAGADVGTVRQVILALAAGILNFLASFDTLVPNLIASVLIALSVQPHRPILCREEARVQTDRPGGVCPLVPVRRGVCGWLDALYRPHPDGHPGCGQPARDGGPRNPSAGSLLPGAWPPLPAGGHGLWHPCGLAAQNEPVCGHRCHHQRCASGADGHLHLHR
jgi:cytochrome c-type biogenesis protein